MAARSPTSTTSAGETRTSKSSATSTSCASSFLTSRRHADSGTADAGVLLNVIGAAADRPNPGYIAGAGGNSALAAMSRAIGSRSMRTGVRVLAVNPGLIITDRMTDLLRQQANAKYGSDERWEEFIPADPVPGTVEQVADVVTFLVSPRASHVSGTTLTIDGGASAR
ncbi:MAG: SDR family oxidoreductase [Acidimicrobiales bacterium]